MIGAKWDYVFGFMIYVLEVYMALTF